MKNKPYVTFISLLTATALLTSCGGRIAHPTPTTYFQDSLKTCEQLEEEMATLQKDILTLEPLVKKTNSENKMLMFSSLFLIFPIAFIDASNADNIEYQALRKRYNYVLKVSDSKKCPTERKYLTIEHAYAKDSPES